MYFLKFLCFRDTYIERDSGESVNDRNDRAIRVAAAWYESHLLPSQSERRRSERVRIVLLTDDANNKDKAQREGILSATSKMFYNF